MSLQSVLRGVALLALAVAGGPAWAEPIEATGAVGGAYQREESEQPGVPSVVQPRWLLNGWGQASGATLDGDLRMTGRVGYDQTRYNYGDSQRQDALSYYGRASLWDERSSKLSIGADAARATTDTATASGATALTGNTTTETYHAGVRASPDALPAVSIGGFLTRSLNSGFDRPDWTENTKVLDVSALHAGEGYSLQVGYHGRWNDGSSSLLDYSAHDASVAAETALGRGVVGFLNLSQSERLPTTSAAGPRFDSGTGRLGVRWGPSLNSKDVEYLYSRQLFSEPSAPERERILQSLLTNDFLTIAPGWETILNANVSLSQSRLGTTEQRGTGQNFTGILRWTRARPESSFSLEAGPTVGLLQPETGPNQYATGGHAATRGSLVRGSSTYSGEYAVDFGHNLNATEGWVFNQSATGRVNGMLFGLGAGLALNASATRSSATLFGEGAARVVALRGDLTRGPDIAWAEVGSSDSTSAAVAGSVRGDGLFIPSTYDVHARYVRGGTKIVVFPRLLLTAQVGYSNLTGPEFVPQAEVQVLGRLDYAVGLFTFGVEDRYIAGGVDYDRRVNQIFARVERRFGARF